MNSPDPYNAGPESFPPIDDGEADRLMGASIPAVVLRSTLWGLSDLRSSVEPKGIIYCYPATGVRGRDPAPNWDSIPGAAGCTVQALGYVEFWQDFRGLGYKVVGVSTQDFEEQREFATRAALPFELLNDSLMEFSSAIGLPQFKIGNQAFLKRLALVVDRNVVIRVFYPVYSPRDNAKIVLEWIHST